MSQSTSIQGLRDPESKEHKANIAAVKALDNADIYKLPPKLAKYFDRHETGEVLHDETIGLCVDISDHVTELDIEMTDGSMVDIRNLPEGVTHIKFCIHY